MILLKMRWTLPLLVIVEGNWLLLDDEKWCQLAQFCDFSIFIKAPICVAGASDESKLAGGLSLADAEAFYDRTDGPNVRRCWKKVCLQI